MGSELPPLLTPFNLLLPSPRLPPSLFELQPSPTDLASKGVRPGIWQFMTKSPGFVVDLVSGGPAGVQEGN